ncbi:MAG: hypothetical protein QOG73_477 [Acetobacteraceae bacterium]|nr:hypothetical protein [Acetobacteraceae bacterium]
MSRERAHERSAKQSCVEIAARSLVVGQAPGVQAALLPRPAPQVRQAPTSACRARPLPSCGRRTATRKSAPGRRTALRPACAGYCWRNTWSRRLLSAWSRRHVGPSCCASTRRVSASASASFGLVMSGPELDEGSAGQGLIGSGGCPGRSVSCAAGEKTRVRTSNVTIKPAKPDAAKIMATITN